MMQRLINITLALMLLLLFCVIYLQQRTINSLIQAEAMSMYQDHQMEHELMKLKRQLNDLQHERARRIGKIERQVDLLIAMRRGPSVARKMMKDKKIRFYLGI